MAFYLRRIGVNRVVTITVSIRCGQGASGFHFLCIGVSGENVTPIAASYDVIALRRMAGLNSRPQKPPYGSKFGPKRRAGQNRPANAICVTFGPTATSTRRDRPGVRRRPPIRPLPTDLHRSGPEFTDKPITGRLSTRWPDRARSLRDQHAPGPEWLDWLIVLGPDLFVRSNSAAYSYRHRFPTFTAAKLSAYPRFPNAYRRAELAEAAPVTEALVSRVVTSA
jgi:hypothetical protein